MGKVLDIWLFTLLPETIKVDEFDFSLFDDFVLLLLILIDGFESRVVGVHDLDKPFKGDVDIEARIDGIPQIFDGLIEDEDQLENSQDLGGRKGTLTFEEEDQAKADEQS